MCGFAALVGDLEVVVYGEDAWDAVGALEEDFAVAFGLDGAYEGYVAIVYDDADGFVGIDGVPHGNGGTVDGGVLGAADGPVVGREGGYFEVVDKAFDAGGVGDCADRVVFVDGFYDFAADFGDAVVDLEGDGVKGITRVALAAEGEGFAELVLELLVGNVGCVDGDLVVDGGGFTGLCRRVSRRRACRRGC